jgi:hypothetical protein
MQGYVNITSQRTDPANRRMTVCPNSQSEPHGSHPLSEVNNGVLKRLVATMSGARLSPKTIKTYTGVAKMVVGSAVDEEGEELYPRKWNHEFIDMPVIEKTKQNAPCFSSSVMTGLASWTKSRERTLFTLCGAAGLRIGEALGIEIDRHISPDFLTIRIRQKTRQCKVEKRLKTESALRDVDLHPAIASLLMEFVGERKAGFLFSTRNGKPVSPTNIIRRHLHPALKQLGYVNPYTRNHKAGNHAFRRYRNTYLRNHTAALKSSPKRSFLTSFGDELVTSLMPLSTLSNLTRFSLKYCFVTLYPSRQVRGFAKKGSTERIGTKPRRLASKMR